ncbi:MAG: thiol peroxidase [Desulfobacterales bacterium]
MPTKGNPAPEFNLTKTDMSDIHLSDFKGRRLVLNIFPSIETPVCSASVKRFNNDVEKLENTEVLCISRDLPFAHARFNVEQERLKMLFRFPSSGFGIRRKLRRSHDRRAMAGAFRKTVVVVDENSKVAYTQLVPEIAEEPDYASVKLLGRDAGDLEFCTSPHSGAFPPNGG